MCPLLINVMRASWHIYVSFSCILAHGVFLTPHIEHKVKEDAAMQLSAHSICIMTASLIARFMGPTWDPSGADWTQVGPMLAPWILLSGMTWKRFPIYWHFVRGSPVVSHHMGPVMRSNKLSVCGILICHDGHVTIYRERHFCFMHWVISFDTSFLSITKAKYCWCVVYACRGLFCVQSKQYPGICLPALCQRLLQGWRRTRRRGYTGFLLWFHPFQMNMFHL